MSETKHSPGPWMVKANNEWAVVDNDRNIVAITTFKNDSPIIAAAPELLAFIDKWIDIYGKRQRTEAEHECMGEMLVLWGKATGEYNTEREP